MAEPTLRSEASCPLCCHLFRDPVSIPCGHHFCRACIERRWPSCLVSFRCPQCHQTAPERSLRPNRQLAEIIRVAQRLSLRATAATAATGDRLCPRHGQPMKLFCEEENVPVCRECRQSPEHRGHSAVPIEEAAEERKEEFQAQAQILKERREKLLELKAAEEGKSLDLLEKLNEERQKVLSQLQELQQLLEKQENLLLERLEKLEKKILQKQEENVSRICQQISSVGQKIREVEEKCRQNPWEILQDSRDTLSRLEKQNSPEQEVTAESTGLSPKIVTLKETPEKFQVTPTLDPDTAHPRLALSADGRSVRWMDNRRTVADHPKRFDSSRCVLGRQGFTAGRHYWEVQVVSGAAWAVGVARASVRRKGRIAVQPAAGIWAVGQCGAQCQALTSPPTPLWLPQTPQVIGVYLDYGEGRVEFWDPQREIPMFSFPTVSFGGEEVMPLLCLGRGCHLTLSP